MDENGIYPPAISGLQPAVGKQSKKSSKPTARGKKALQTKRQNEITDAMEAIYRDLFDRVRYHGLVQGPQSSHQIDLEEQTPEVGVAFKDLTKSSLDLASEMDTWQAITALRATYWTAVRVSGYDFYKPNTVITEAEDESHAGASILMSAASGSSGPRTRYYTVHATSLLWGRYYQVAAAHGWKTLAVLLHSMEFTSFARTEAPSQWESLLTCIGENSMSLQLVGSFYCRGWDDAVKKALPEGVDILTDDEKKSYSGDYYDWRVPSDTNARVFEESDPPPVAAETSPQDRFSRDPSGEQDALDVQEPCSVCSHPLAECKCNLENWAPARVELVSTEDMGTGVRALQRFKKGQLLVEFVGDLLGQEDDNSTSARYNGSWARFLNHSRNPNCSIENTERRGKTLSIYRARRDIELFDEITVNTGVTAS